MNTLSQEIKSSEPSGFEKIRNLFTPERMRNVAIAVCISSLIGVGASACEAVTDNPEVPESPLEAQKSLEAQAERSMDELEKGIGLTIISLLSLITIADTNRRAHQNQ